MMKNLVLILNISAGILILCSFFEPIDIKLILDVKDIQETPHTKAIKEEEELLERCRQTLEREKEHESSTIKQD